MLKFTPSGNIQLLLNVLSNMWQANELSWTDIKTIKVLLLSHKNISIHKALKQEYALTFAEKSQQLQ